MALIKTKGLVMRSLKYRETSLICDIFCRETGMRSFLVQGVRKQRSKLGAGFFQPMQILSLVVYENPNAGLQKIKEANATGLFLDLQANIPKSAVGLFILELARRSIRETSPNESLFDFLEESLEWIEGTRSSLSLLPLWLSIRMTAHLGFEPHIPDILPSSPLFFDLRDGICINSRPFHSDFLSEPHSEHFTQLARAEKEDLADMSLSRQDRNILLDRVIDYYRLHVEHLGKLRSPDIFRELF